MNQPIDQAALRAASNSFSPKLPEWLSVGKQVYSRQHNCHVTVLDCLGERVLAQLDNQTIQVDVTDLSPVKASSLTLDAIEHPTYRAFASGLLGELNAVKVIPGQESESVPLPEDLHPYLKKALQANGITGFYSHQGQSWREIGQGKSLALVTPTSSGKTHCFVPRAFQFALAQGRTTLLLYPLRALAQDQYEKIVAINDALPVQSRLKIVRCTGDVPLEERKQAFRGGQCPDIILMSPDVLHHQLYHSKNPKMRLWQEFLSRLSLVVCDESHTYTSAFGIHFANITRRLRLACLKTGNRIESLSWVISTATISNPVELSSLFTGLPPEQITLINRSGAKAYKRALLVFKPQSAPNFVTVSLINTLIGLGLKGLVFVNSRCSGKQIFTLLSLGGAGVAVDLFYGSIRSSRRCELIERLSNNQLNALITTSALEAGIDLPELDFVILRGSNSLNALWQRAGRCGRKSPGLVIFIPDNANHIDYYYSTQPERLFAPVEQVKLQPNYSPVLAKHLLCASAEGGIPASRVTELFGEGSDRVVAELLKQNQLRWSRERVLWSKGYPHKTVSIRGIVSNTIELVNEDTGEVIEEMSLNFAHRECHEGAIYLTSQDGETITWRCQSLEPQAGKALLKQDDLAERRTRPEVELKVCFTSSLEPPKIISTAVEEGNFRLSLWWGSVSERVNGYAELELSYAPTCANCSCSVYNQAQPENQRRCKNCHQSLSNRLTTKTIDEVEFDEPLVTSFEAPVLRIEVNQVLAQAISDRATAIREELLAQYQTPENVPEQLSGVFEVESVFLALHSLTHLMIKAIPLLFLASDQDVNSLSLKRSQVAGNAHQSIAFIYDAVNEGCGTTEAVFEDWGTCATKALELAKGCDCGSMGCPRCLNGSRLSSRE